MFSFFLQFKSIQLNHKLPIHKFVKGALSGLRPFLATESSLKTTKHAFNFTLKTLCVIRIFKFLSRFFCHAEKRLHEKDKVNFKKYIVTTWLTNNCNPHIDQHLKKERQSGNEIYPVNSIHITHEKHFPWKMIHKLWWRNYFQTLF